MTGFYISETAYPDEIIPLIDFGKCSWDPWQLHLSFVEEDRSILYIYISLTQYTRYSSDVHSQFTSSKYLVPVRLQGSK